jgi:hypothetical protein
LIRVHPRKSAVKDFGFSFPLSAMTRDSGDGGDFLLRASVVNILLPMIK